ncbi:MAG: hypothetical protein OEM62_13350, partial [Acidobacteriota bacterium]|nr:hypothetical protein [Acidobacteriota bacterium]
MSLKGNVKALVLVLGLALVAQAAVAGSVAGKITYDDKVPSLRPVDMNADPVCASKHDSPVYPDVLVLGDGNALANVFVQIKNAPAGGSASTDPVVVDQKG